MLNDVSIKPFHHDMGESNRHSTLLWIVFILNCLSKTSRVMEVDKGRPRMLTIYAKHPDGNFRHKYEMI